MWLGMLTAPQQEGPACTGWHSLEKPEQAGRWQLWGCLGTGAAVGWGSLAPAVDDGDGAVDHTSATLVSVNCLSTANGAYKPLSKLPL